MEDRRGEGGCGADLATPALAILGALNNAREIQHLDLGSPVPHHAWHACEGRELI